MPRAWNKIRGCLHRDASLPDIALAWYESEDAGAKIAQPVFPTFEKLPIIRPPDPFVFASGKRDL
jgi:hypothetical protein